ncbi:hypothetical protein DCAR_0205627 [Daucus carota subsp. sativus]|uniref:Rad21/Rec8-like protein N-terminal domain-containing protein n=2 Tax=Daucus carota subsp. sativus TaxID=79200 RepID=A0AAF0WE36_DAUCS|nr:hypothetical protein DCAR_0205627 [Daucus carota subsp. sativus]
MFSSTILMADRSLGKGPLRTILGAASCDSKLTKSIYASIDISTAVELIMYPEVPLAMRMSSHLLFGIVRIHAQQVESLLRDSNTLLIEIRNAFTSTDLMNLSHATFGSVLPDKFKLDSLDIDTDFSESSWDNHLKDTKEITLEDYSGTLVGATLGAEHCDPSNRQLRAALLSYNDGYPSYQGTEIMREAAFFQYASEMDLFCPDQREDRLEPDWDLMKILEKTEADNLGVELVPAASPLSSQQHQQPISILSEETPEFLDPDSDYGWASPTLQIPSIPQPQQTLPKEMISHQYDINTTILSDKFMKKRIADSSSILRPRKNFRRDPLGRWRQNKRIRKDVVFFEPLLTGLGSDLCEAYRKDFICGKPYLCAPVNVDNMEIDHEISTENNSPNRVLYSPIEFTPSPTGGHALGGDTSSLIDQVEPTNWDSTRVLEKYAATPGSNEITASLKGTPGEGPYNPEIRTSCDGELSFLAEDDNNSQGPQQTTPGYSSWKSEGGQLSARTRSVARFLKDRSSVTPVIERDHQSINVSLDTILEGKRRKVCARIVFETLVLKTCSLVDVKQENPYGDVVLTVTPKLSNELFSI